jgi:hypothetical protein
MTTESLTAGADAQTRRPWFRAMARAGMAARGAIFLIIGILAIQVATGTGGTTTDQGGALAAVAGRPFGKGLLVALAIGLAAYALWRVAQGLLDTDDKGDDAPAWAVRASKVGSGIAYGVLFATAVSILAGEGGGGSGSGSERQTTAGVLGWPGGRAWVLIAAAVIAGVAGWNLYRGLSRNFMKRLHPPRRACPAVQAVGVAGMTARGVVFGLIAAFLAKAAIEYDPSEAVGLDGALARLAQEAYGPALLFLVAAGLIAFALYCGAEARYREV